MADQPAARGKPTLVMFDRVPRVYALHADDRIESWVIALPSGDALIVDPDGQVTGITSLDRIEARHARRGGPTLVEVVECPLPEVRAA